MSWWTIALATLSWTIVATAPARADHLNQMPESRPGAPLELRHETRPSDTAPQARFGMPLEVSQDPRAIESPPPPSAPPQSLPPSADVRIDMKLNADGFRLGGTVASEAGTYGAYVDGRRAPGGFVVNGEVQKGSQVRTYRFSLQAEGLEGLAWGLARQWLLGF